MSIKNETKSRSRRLEVKKQTLRDLTPRKDVKAGRMAETKWTYCGQGGPTECYKPNPY